MSVANLLGSTEIILNRYLEKYGDEKGPTGPLGPSGGPAGNAGFTGPVGVDSVVVGPTGPVGYAGNGMEFANFFAVGGSYTVSNGNIFTLNGTGANSFSTAGITKNDNITSPLSNSPNTGTEITLKNIGKYLISFTASVFAPYNTTAGESVSLALGTASGNETVLSYTTVRSAKPQGISPPSALTTFAGTFLVKTTVLNSTLMLVVTPSESDELQVNSLSNINITIKQVA